MTKILLVEDDKAIVANLTEFLKNEGYTVKSVSGQTAALDMLSEERSDLVLLDVSLAEGNGFAACKAIKEEYGPARVIREFFLNNPSPEVEAYCKANKAKFATLMDVYKKGVKLCGTDEIPESAYPRFVDAECFE